MEFKYRVHNVTQGPTARVDAMVGKQKMSVITDCVRAELVSVDGRNGTLTINAIGDDRAAAADLFKQDAELTISISPFVAK
jgi:hypothetical protein